MSTGVTLTLWGCATAINASEMDIEANITDEITVCCDCVVRGEFRFGNDDFLSLIESELP